MTPLKQIFLELSELPPHRRAELLEARCGGDARLRQQVQSLLDAHDLGEREEGGPTVDVARDAAPPPPEQIGPYRILEQLGEGGFAKVYLAEQERPVRRRVALKVLKPGMDSGHVVARFHAERQALAVMNHPNVAKVFDAGVTEHGRPYFVMEHVPGESITAFCDRQQYTTRQRLELFCQACAAIQHAHQKAIIHRDLKPSNILVMLQDDAPLVKVIDFGVAKALAQPLTERPLFTGTGQLIGTPEYMSPEQAQMSAPDVDTRSDIYSLGVVLYELLSGALPFDAVTLRSAGYDEVQRIIRQVEPPRPSTRLSSLAGRADEVAQKRRTHLAALRRELRSELEWIPLKAMRKERDRRYASAQQLAEDIRNYLEKRPLIAGPESGAYRLRKFARRNRGPIAAAAALLLALLLGVVTTSVMYVRAEQQRREALRQKQIAQSRFDDVRKLANTFLFDVHEKIAKLSGATPARASLVNTALEYLQKLSAQAGDDPQLLREIQEAYIRVGDVQGHPGSANLGDTRGALDSYRKALAIARRLADADPRDARAQRDLALCHTLISDMLAAVGDTRAALDGYPKALSIAQRLADADPGDVLARRQAMLIHRAIGDARVTAADTRGALDSHRAALGIAEALASADPADPEVRRDLALSHDRIGDMFAAVGDADAALQSYRTAMGFLQGLSDADPTNAAVLRVLAGSHAKVGAMLARRGETARAIASHRTALGIRQKLADADPTDASAQRGLLVSYDRMGATLAAAGDLRAALESYRQMLEIAQKLADADPANANVQRDLALSHHSIADVLALSGDTAGAVESFRRSGAIARKLVEADPTNSRARADLAFSHGGIGEILLATGDAAGALDSFRASLQINEQLAEDDPTHAIAQRNLWVSLNKMGMAYETMAGDAERTTAERIELLEQARAWYLRQAAQAEAMEQRSLLSADDARLAGQARRAAARCEARIAELSGAAPPTSSPATQPGVADDD